MNHIATCRIDRSFARAAIVTLALAARVTESWAADGGAAAARPLPVAVVDTLNTLSGGPHAGDRANHAKGVLVTGEFMPAPTAPGLSKAAHFVERVPVLVRLSNGTGLPTMPDADGNASGPTTPTPTPTEQFLGSHPIAAQWVTTPRPAPANPQLLQDGVEPSADAVLPARPGAYAVSYGQRAQ